VTCERFRREKEEKKIEEEKVSKKGKGKLRWRKGRRILPSLYEGYLRRRTVANQGREDGI